MAQVDTFDVSARKFHQFVCVALLALAYLAEAAVAWVAIGLVLLVGGVLAGGRFWWQLDVFRQIAWRWLEPAGLLRRREAVEDHATRRVARVLGGVALILSAGLIALGQPLAWIVVAAIAVMIFLDAAFDY